MHEWITRLPDEKQDHSLLISTDCCFGTEKDKTVHTKNKLKPWKMRTLYNKITIISSFFSSLRELKPSWNRLLIGEWTHYVKSNQITWSDGLCERGIPEKPSRVEKQQPQAIYSAWNRTLVKRLLLPLPQSYAYISEMLQFCLERTSQWLPRLRIHEMHTLAIVVSD